MAVLNGRAGVTKLLLEAGANTEMMDSNLKTPIFYTIPTILMNDNYKCMELLLSYGANVDHISNVSSKQAGTFYDVLMQIDDPKIQICVDFCNEISKV